MLTLQSTTETDEGIHILTWQVLGLLQPHAKVARHANLNETDNSNRSENNFQLVKTNISTHSDVQKKNSNNSLNLQSQHEFLQGQ